MVEDDDHDDELLPSESEEDEVRQAKRQRRGQARKKRALSESEEDGDEDDEDDDEDDDDPKPKRGRRKKGGGKRSSSSKYRGDVPQSEALIVVPKGCTLVTNNHPDSFEGKQICCLCGRSGNWPIEGTESLPFDTTMIGPFHPFKMYPEADFYCHKGCAVWTLNCFEDAMGEAVNAEYVVRRALLRSGARRKPCSVCGGLTALNKCRKTQRCPAVIHVPCALERGLLVDHVRHEFFCPTHSEEIRKQVSDAIAAINRDEEFRQKMLDGGYALVDVPYGPEMDAFMAERAEEYIAAARSAGVLN